MWTMTLYKLDDSYLSRFLVGCHRLLETQRSKQLGSDVASGVFRESESLLERGSFELISVFMVKATEGTVIGGNCTPTEQI